jgi:mannitol/fructose-specific phosphotransferase system IIA component (Ntr-type)
MDLGGFEGPVGLSAEGPLEAMEELIDHLVAKGKIQAENRNEVVKAVREREASASTRVGFGCAVPHAASDLVDEVVGMVGYSRNGIRFAASDSEVVNLVILFVVPQGQAQQHVNVLAKIAKMIQRADFRDDLRRRFQ